MLVPRWILRFIFAASALATWCVLVTAAVPRQQLHTAAVYVYGVAAALALATCLMVFHRGRLLVSAVNVRSFVKSFAIALVLSYGKLALLVGMQE